MIVTTFHLDKYDWDVQILYNVLCSDFDKIEKYLQYNDCPEEVIEGAYDYIKTCKCNKGFTYSNKKERKSTLVIGKASCIKQYINTIIHEAYHLTQHIKETCNLNEEEQAELIGGFMMDQYYIINNILH